MESTIVTVDDLKKFTSIGANIDCELLYPHLLIAQQLYLEPVLGCALYNDIISRFDNNQLTGDTQTLYELYIIPALGFSAWYSVAPFLNWHTNRNGINTMGTDAVTPTTIDEFSMYLTKVENLKAFYLHRLEEYLICNKTLFPLYCQNDVPQSNGGSIFLDYKTNPKRGEYWDKTSYSSTNIETTNNGNCNDCPDCC